MLIPLLIVFLILQVVLFFISGYVEDLEGRALIFSKWSGVVNSVLLFVVFSAFIALSWDTIKERKIAQLELSKPISKNIYFVIKFLCFGVIVLSTAFICGIISQVLGVVIYGQAFLNAKRLSYGIKVADYEGKNIRVEGLRNFGAKLKENILIADIENTGELEFQFNIYKEYTGMSEYYLYFKAQIISYKNNAYLRFKVYSDVDEKDVYQFDEKVVSMKSHFFRLPSKLFNRPCRLYVNVSRLEKEIYMLFNQFEPQILYKKENVVKTMLKETVFQSLVSLQSVTPAYLLSAFVSPPTALIGSLIFWIWANSKELLKVGRKHVTSKILVEEDEDKHHRHESLDFPLFLEKLSLSFNKFVDRLIPDFKSFSFVLLMDKGITINDSEFLVRVGGTIIGILIMVIVISLFFKLYEFPV